MFKDIFINYGPSAIYIVGPLVLLLVGYAIGSLNELTHFQSIRKREDELLAIPLTTFDDVENESQVYSASLVTGSVVISLDYFKRFLAAIRTILGGEVKAYSPLLDRGRREAILRMKEQSPHADAYINLRVETSTIAKSTSGKKKATGGVEILAFATAVKYKP